LKSTEPAATCKSATQANEVEQNSAGSDVSDGETLTMESGTKAESVGFPDFRVVYEPPYAEPLVRWCGRTVGATLPPTRFCMILVNVDGY
jgi:hypothetical protein